jgi:hypothetical protein
MVGQRCILRFDRCGAAPAWRVYVHSCSQLVLIWMLRMNDGKTARQVLARRGVSIEPDLKSKPRAESNCQGANRLCASIVRFRFALVLQSLRTRRAANVRNPAVCVRPRCAAHSVSHLVEDCDHGETLSLSTKSYKENFFLFSTATCAAALDRQLSLGRHCQLAAGERHCAPAPRACVELQALAGVQVVVGRERGDDLGGGRTLLGQRGPARHH